MDSQAQYIMFKVIGFIAAGFSTFAMLPQALHVYRTGEVEQLSLRAFAMATVGAVLWLVYGILIDDVVIIAANFVGMGIVGYIFAKRYSFMKLQKSGDGMALRDSTDK